MKKFHCKNVCYKLSANNREIFWRIFLRKLKAIDFIFSKIMNLRMQQNILQYAYFFASPISFFLHCTSFKVMVNSVTITGVNAAKVYIVYIVQ